MTADHASLSAFLDRAYIAQFHQREPMETIVGECRTAIEADPAFAAEARAESVRLATIPDNRCVITRTHKAFLKNALNP